MSESEEVSESPSQAVNERTSPRTESNANELRNFLAGRYPIFTTLTTHARPNTRSSRRPKTPRAIIRSPQKSPNSHAYAEKTRYSPWERHLLFMCEFPGPQGLMTYSRETTHPPAPPTTPDIPAS